jgi:hypothetical protein
MGTATGDALRSKFSVAYARSSSSGQGDPETFPSFCDGDTALLYCFCIFHNKSAMDYALRLLPERAHAVEGIPGFSKQMERKTMSSAKKSKTSAETSIADIASQIAEAMSKPVRIEQVSSGDSRFMFSKHVDMAETVPKLMELEKKLQQRVDTCTSPDLKELFRARLKNVSERIADSMGVNDRESME